MDRSTYRRSSQRGAVLIHVAIALLGLIAFSTFVADYGIMWVSRGQAQTAADAGALSGAIALAYEGSTDFAGAKQKARLVAIANAVFGAAPDVALSDVTFPVCPPGSPGAGGTCVKVDAFRNVARGNPLPMFFGNLVGLTNQGVQATATAQILTGTTTDCLKPWAILDRWDEYNAPGGEPDYPNPDLDFNYTSTYDKYSTGQGQSPAAEPDLYVPPSSTGPGTGFRLPQDQGRQFAVKVGEDASQISSGWFRAIRIPRLDVAL
jgi:Flp pilus assembly protein TadG